MTDYTSDWTIGVVSQSGRFHENLKNALLYADEVLWLPTAIPIFRSLGDVQAASEYMGDWAEWRGEELEEFEAFLSDTLDGLEKEHLLQQEFLEKIRQDDLPIRIPVAYEYPYADSLVETVGYFHMKARRGPEYVCRVLREIALDISPTEEFHADRSWGSPLEGSHVAVFDGDKQERVLLPQHWQSYPATQILMNSVQRILMPDMCHLEFDDILELRKDAYDELTGMRGELLKLSAELRKLTGDEAPYETIVREAENLIGTEVESEVRQVRVKLRDIQKKSRRSLIGKAGEVFGLVLGGFFIPALWADAFKQALKIPQDVLDQEGLSDIASSTTQFVLKAERFVDKHARS